MSLTPVPDYPGLFARKPMAGLYLQISASARKLATREQEPLEMEAASVIAAAYHCGRLEDGSRIWESLDAVESDEDVYRPSAVGNLALELIPEKPSGN